MIPLDVAISQTAQAQPPKDDEEDHRGAHHWRCYWIDHREEARRREG